jgi:hypothetical protein
MTLWEAIESEPIILRRQSQVRNPIGLRLTCLWSLEVVHRIKVKFTAVLTTWIGLLKLGTTWRQRSRTWQICRGMRCSKVSNKSNLTLNGTHACTPAVMKCEEMICASITVLHVLFATVDR